MKRLPSIAFFLFALTVLFPAGFNLYGIQTFQDQQLPGQQDSDTSGLLKQLKVRPFNLEIIPPSTGVQFYGNGIIFLSNTKYEGKMLPKHVSFGSIEAYSAIVRDSTLGMHMLFSPDESFSFPCEATTFTTDFRTMYYTKISNKDKKEKIYKAEYKAGSKGTPSWESSDKPMEFCTGDNIYTHPAISADGNTMIFSSDMPGTNGGMDLYVVRKEGDKWSSPKNLTKSINTARDECFPYLDKNNNLYFSSNGLPGYGGYDIFTCRAVGELWERPVNLSKKINTENDDVAFSIDKITGDYGFYTSRKITGSKEMQLMKVNVMQNGSSTNPLTLAAIFNGNPVKPAEMLAAKPKQEEEKAPAVTTKSEAPKQAPAEIKKDTEVKKTTAEPAPKTQDAKVVIIKNTSELPAELRDKVIYRVQFFSTGKQRTEKSILFNGVTYKTYEYFYLNLYRYTVGEFTTLGPARNLQEIVRNSGYPDAFIAAFKNDMRSLDLALFK